MNKKLAFSLAFIITILFYLSYSYFNLNNSQIEREKGIIGRVIDGDTLELKDGRTLRLLNINAPEKINPLSKQSTALVKLFENSSIDIEITGKDIYNRYLARIYTPVYLNLELVKQGLASKFLVQDTELKVFADAEASAIKDSRGIWHKSQYYNCFSSEINEKEEKVIIKNKCSPIDISEWILKDESRKEYLFNTTISDEIILYSGIGKDSDYILFWNSKTNIWNNNRDSLYLFDKEGNLALYQTYGY